MPISETRHVDHRQDHRLPVLQEEQHDDGHQDDRVAQRLEDLVDRLADEGRRVVDDRVLEARAESGPCSSFILRLDAVGRVERVGAGQLKDRQADRRLAVERAARVLVLGAQFDAGHVLADRVTSPPVPRLDDDVAELLGLVQPAQRGHGVLEVVARGHRRLADLAGGDLHVLLAQRLDDVAGRQVARRQLVRVEPDAHAVVLLAQTGRRRRRRRAAPARP